jgi:phosphomethylpyrimidine synthase
MVTQLNSAKRGIATEELIQVAREEQVDVSFILKHVANGSIIIPKNMERKQHIKSTGIGKGIRTKVNVNIGTSTLNQNINQKVSTYRILIR